MTAEQEVDIAKIASNMKGWKLAVVSEDAGGGITDWVFSRFTSDEQHLILSINLLERIMRFSERIRRGGGGVSENVFSVTCRELRSIQVVENQDEIIFYGDITYSITHLDSTTDYHLAKLPNSDRSIVTRDYKFSEPPTS